MTQKRSDRNPQDRNLREFLEDEDQKDLDERLRDAEGEVHRPPRNDPRHTDGNIPPGERDVPAGGSTGEFMGGSAKKRKGQSG